ncbi:hypothetical protein [Cohnella cholangitidis]|uniref:Uncharacterized protein n=1 Tax=Cohnella cholangitidis TaxID=2598458 RepID=A0A7G5BSX9_9BACL|nr:hypothetical protein [Cohnella cholangitidis]QMV40063.1 hypothetical protein FPL14_01755 [Cohnella cholangitidis]
MKHIKKIIIPSILINLIMVTYIVMKTNHLKSSYSNLSFELQNDLVQLESSIDYQIKNNWNEENTVIEKIEDVRESINYLMVTGKDLGIMSKSQENDLWKLNNIFSKFPTYSGFPNSKLDQNNINELILLGNNLKSAGWGMNIGYSSDWKSFTTKINALNNM